MRIDELKEVIQQVVRKVLIEGAGYTSDIVTRIVNNANKHFRTYANARWAVSGNGDKMIVSIPVVTVNNKFRFLESHQADMAIKLIEKSEVTHLLKNQKATKHNGTVMMNLPRESKKMDAILSPSTFSYLTQ